MYDFLTEVLLTCSVPSPVEMGTKSVPCHAVEEGINVIPAANRKLFLVVTLELVLNG